MKIIVIDYGSGNLRSAAKAVETAANAVNRNAEVKVSSVGVDLRGADRIILPGQGAFGDCMEGLAALDGMLECLEAAVIHRAIPFMGICVGMQLMAARGLEHGERSGLGWFPGSVKRLKPSDTNFKIPHMGWNNLTFHQKHPVFAGLPEVPHMYFVHSFAYTPVDQNEVIAHVDYGGLVSAAVGRDNLIGVQFHPDKSQDEGLRVLANFICWQP